MLRGKLTATQQLALLSSYDNLAQALEGAFFVQVTHYTTPSMLQSRGTTDKLVSADLFDFIIHTFDMTHESQLWSVLDEIWEHASHHCSAHMFKCI